MQRPRCVFWLIVVLISACATPPDPKDALRELGAAELYAQSREALRRGDTDNALLYLDTLQVRFPQNDHALQAQLDIILAYYQREDYDFAINAAEQFLKLNPGSPLGAYATYMVGRSETARFKSLFEKQVPRDFADYDQRVLSAALQAYREVVRRYPDSEWANDARNRLNEIVGHTARHEVKTAQYYFDRGAFVGAANRAQALLVGFPDSEYATAALQILYNSYRAQGLLAQAERVRALLTEADPTHALATQN